MTSFADSKTFTMDMCPIDTKLDGNSFVSTNLSSMCKSQVKTEDLMGTDADFSSDFMLDNVPSLSCKPRKTDDMNSGSVFLSDTCDGLSPSIPMTMGSSESLVDGGQPLNSNVVNKQSLMMDAQYMQQQNQVFVFPTQLANKSAELVMKGNYNSIIEYHCAQLETKKYLMRHSLKVKSTAKWDHLTHLKHKSAGGGNARCGVAKVSFRNNHMMSADMLKHGCVPPPSSVNMSPRQTTWNQQSNMNAMNSSNMVPPPQMCGTNMMPGGPGAGCIPPGVTGLNSVGVMHGNMLPMKCQPQPSTMDMMSDPSNNTNPLMSNSVLPPGPPLGNFSDDHYPLSPRAQLKGMKVPDENLTPSQRLQREDKLAHLQRIKQLLMSAENQQPPLHHPLNSEIPPSAHNAMSVEDISLVLAADRNGSGVGSMDESTDGSGSKTTNAGPNSGVQVAPADWQGMPSFYDERSKRVADVSNMNRCGSRSQGPPPPYSQTARSASIPIVAPSPNPNSPGNATSNLSLPSPRACSGMNSPVSKQQGPGPSPTANQSNTSIESPSQSHGGRGGVNISNPGTPVSSGMHLSPNSKQKENKMGTGPMSNEFSPAASGQQSPDGIYSRSLQSLARQQQQKQQPSLPHTQAMPSANSHCKEPPLMPVPSPQHISYLSSFDGQELIIQKQPNTSLKESSNMTSPSLDTIIPVSADNSCSKVTISAPNTPLTPSSLDLGPSKYPSTPGDFSVLSPGPDSKTQVRGNNSSQMRNDLRFSGNSPQMIDQQQRFQSTSTTSFMSQTNKNSFLDASPPEKASGNLTSEVKEAATCAGGSFPRGMMPNNVPIDPTAAPKPPSFDPISSLAQMSQQLTNSVPGSPGSQVGMIHSNMMPYNPSSGSGHVAGGNLNMMPMNEMAMCGNPNGEPPIQDNSGVVFNSQMPPGMNPMAMANNGRIICPNNIDGGPLKPGNMAGAYPPMMAGNPPSRMMRPQGPMTASYNNANVQVKPSAPNTIQYLPNPNRPQSVGAGAVGRPSLELMRYQNPNPMSPNMERMQAPAPPPPPPNNMNYFQGNFPSGHLPGSMNELMGNMNCAMPPGNSMVRPGMRGMNPPPPNMMRMVGGGNMGMPPYSEQMYPSAGGSNVNMTNNNCHMFISNAAAGPGPKMPPMSMSGNVAPDATQPLPPSMGQAGNFKNSSFMSQPPEMNDPQYRQQYHNFQQQLYATNTRGPMSHQPMPVSNQQYFLPK